MKNLQFLLAHGLLLISTAFLQAQPVTYAKVFYDSQFSGIQANSVVPSYDTGYIIAGTGNYQDGFILKVDSAGNALWNKKFANTFNNIIQTNDSCFVLAGSIYNPSTANQDAYCAKINSNGDTIWSKAISQTGYNNLTALSVNQTIDSGYILTGYYTDNLAPYHRIFAAKLDVSGNLQWTNILTGGSQENIGYSVKQTPDSGFVIIGYLETYPPFIPNALLLKLTPAGSFSWAKKYNLNSNLFCSGNDIDISSSGFLCYLSMGYNTAIMKTDFSGNILWNKFNNMNTSNSNGINAPASNLNKTFDGAFVFGTGGHFGGNLIKVDTSGNIIWSRNAEFGYADAVALNNNGYFIVGNGPLYGIQPYSNVASPQIGIIKTDSSVSQNCMGGNSVSTVIDTIISSIATFTGSTGGTGSAVHPVIDSVVIVTNSGCVDFIGGIQEANSENDLIVYPNPSPGIFTFNANETQLSQIIICNFLGQTIYQSEISNQKSQIDLTTKPEGIYFYKIISTNKNMVTGKLVILD